MGVFEAADESLGYRWNRLFLALLLNTTVAAAVDKSATAFKLPAAGGRIRFEECI